MTNKWLKVVDNLRITSDALMHCLHKETSVIKLAFSALPIKFQFAFPPTYIYWP